MKCQYQGFGPVNPGERPEPLIADQNRFFSPDRYPAGMGYVPMQNWEPPFPLDHGFQRGTIFPSLDYPFVMGRCRR